MAPGARGRYFPAIVKICDHVKVTNDGDDSRFLSKYVSHPTAKTWPAVNPGAARDSTVHF